MKKCPFCVEEIQEEAIKCKHCGSIIQKQCPACGMLNDANKFRCVNEDCLSILPQGESTLLKSQIPQKKVVSEVKYGGWIIGMVVALILILSVFKSCQQPTAPLHTDSPEEAYFKGYDMGKKYGLFALKAQQEKKTGIDVRDLSDPRSVNKGFSPGGSLSYLHRYSLDVVNAYESGYYKGWYNSYGY